MTEQDTVQAANSVKLTVEGTPRHYITFHRKTPFRRLHRFAEGEPAWVKAGRGVLAVTDGSKRQMIAPGLLFAVEQDGDGTYRIGTYGRGDGLDTDGIGRPYTLLTVRTAISDGLYVRRGWVSYNDMVMAVRRVLPMAWVPTEAEFFAEYGL